MINGFSAIVQKDIGLMFDAVCGKIESKEENLDKVYQAGIRILAAAGMFAGIVLAAGALPFVVTAPVGGLLIMGLAVGVFALSHDVFVMSKNHTEQKALLKGAKANVKAFAQDGWDFLKGKKSLTDAPRQPLTENTFLRPLWDKAFAVAQAA